MNISELFPPLHSRDSEEALAGAALRAPEIVFEDDRVAQVQPEHFFILALSTLWRIMLDLRAEDKAIDLVTVTEALTSRGKLEEVGTGETYGLAYLTRLTNQVPSSVHAPEYAATVIEMADRRKVIDLASDLHASAINPKNGSAASLMVQARQDWSEVKLSADSDEDWGYVNLAQHVEEHGIPKVLFHLEGAIPIGSLGVIHGKSFSGKTFISDDLILATCLSGTCWGIETPVRPGPVIYLAGDQSLAVSAARLLDMSKGRGAPGLPNNLIFTPEPKDMGDPEELARLEQLIERHEAVMVAIDSLSVYKSQQLSENLPDDMTEFFRPFRAMLTRHTDLVIYFIHHDGLRSDLRGATTIRDRPEWVFKVTASGDGLDLAALLVNEKLKGADYLLKPNRELGLARDPDGKGLIVTWRETGAQGRDPDQKPPKRQQAMEACIEHLQESEGAWVSGADLQRLCEGARFNLSKSAFYNEVAPKLAAIDGVEAETTKPMRFRWA